MHWNPKDTTMKNWKQTNEVANYKINKNVLHFYVKTMN